MHAIGKYLVQYLAQFPSISIRELGKLAMQVHQEYNNDLPLPIYPTQCVPVDAIVNHLFGWLPLEPHGNAIQPLPELARARP